MNKKKEKEDIKENFTNIDSIKDFISKLGYLYIGLFILAIIIYIYGIYLSFKCNAKFNILEFLGALLFSPFYIVYKLVKGCKKSVKSNLDFKLPPNALLGQNNIPMTLPQSQYNLPPPIIPNVQPQYNMQPPSPQFNMQPPSPQFNMQPPSPQYNMQPPSPQFNMQPPPQQYNMQPPPQQYNMQPPPQQYNIPQVKPQQNLQLQYNPSYNNIPQMSTNSNWMR